MPAPGRPVWSWPPAPRMGRTVSMATGKRRRSRRLLFRLARGGVLLGLALVLPPVPSWPGGAAGGGEAVALRRPQPGWARVAYTLVVAGARPAGHASPGGRGGRGGPRRRPWPARRRPRGCTPPSRTRSSATGHRSDFSRTVPVAPGRRAASRGALHDRRRRLPQPSRPRRAAHRPAGPLVVEGDLVDESATVRRGWQRNTGVVVRNLGLSGYGPAAIRDCGAALPAFPSGPPGAGRRVFEGTGTSVDAEFFDRVEAVLSIPWNENDVLDVLRSRRGSGGFLPAPAPADAGRARGHQGRACGGGSCRRRR